VDLPRAGIGERLDRPALDAAERTSNDARRLVLLPGLRSGSNGSTVPLARDDYGRDENAGDDDRRDDG
jgi:hypothetical protein